MSTDPLERAVDNAFVPQQSQIGRYRPEDRRQDFHLDCEDCVHHVTAHGDEQSAVACARRHVEKRALCEAVTVTEGDSEATICRVRADGVEDLREVERA